MTLVKTPRYPIIDTVRGVAILAMMTYHFGFDLSMQGYIVQDLNHSLPWLVARSLILSTFLLVSGFSLALAQHHTAKQRWLRLGRIAGCAFLVSVGSYFMFPESWIFFGVLHFIVLATMLCWFLARHEKWLLPLAFVSLGLGLLFQSAMFNQPMLQWLGMMTFKPITEDYVPMLPWLGLIFIGLRLGIWANTNRASATPVKWPLAITPPTALKPVGFLGRHSLAVYMLHQPILLGLLSAYGAIFR
jgi:uncharacterized membrane protein